MSEKHNDGGYAFPSRDQHYTGQTAEMHYGLTIRDYFAGQAMQAMVSRDSAVDAAGKLGTNQGRRDSDIIAEAAYAYADALLAERDKQKATQ